VIPQIAGQVPHFCGIAIPQVAGFNNSVFQWYKILS